MTIAEAVAQRTIHDHLCLIYDTEAEQFAAALPFIRSGLQAGHYCLYVADEHTVGTVRSALQGAHVDVDQALNSGQLALETKKETYLKEGTFDADAMVGRLAEACRHALTAGYSGLRITGEMTWFLGSEAKFQELLRYEAKLNMFFPQYPALAICQYNRERFRPEIIRDVLRAHPLVIYKNVVCRNYYYVPPEELLADEADASQEVARLLSNILERERKEQSLEQALQKLQDAQAELVEKVKELEKFEEVTVGRELRMMELEQRIRELEKKRS